MRVCILSRVWHVHCMYTQALTDVHYAPDFTARVECAARIVIISRAEVHAVLGIQGSNTSPVLGADSLAKRMSLDASASGGGMGCWTLASSAATPAPAGAGAASAGANGGEQHGGAAAGAPPRSPLMRRAEGRPRAVSLTLPTGGGGGGEAASSGGGPLQRAAPALMGGHVLMGVDEGMHVEPPPTPIQVAAAEMIAAADAHSNRRPGSSASSVPGSPPPQLSQQPSLDSRTAELGEF